MKLYSKTIERELDVETMEKEQNGQILTVIKHASLMDIIYNQIELCKDPDCIKIEDARPNSPYPVYKCTLWDKTRNRCTVGIGSGKPETLPAGIPADYADESASNRAFDRAAITYLQFPGRQLSEEEVGIFIPVDLTPSVDLPEEPMNDEPVPAIKEAPIKTQVADNFTGAMNPPVETPTEEPAKEDEVDAPAEATSSETNDEELEMIGAKIIQFGKYKNSPITVKEVCESDLVWVDCCLKIEHPSVTIADSIEALRTYRNAMQ